MKESPLLARVTIPTSCPADWEQMEGDERSRYCRSCSKHVYNLSAMDSAQVVSLIREKEGKLCARFYRRCDGTIVTASCRDRRKTNFLQFSLASLLTLVTGAAVALGIARYVPWHLIPLNKETTLSVQQTSNQRSEPLAGVICILPEDGLWQDDVDESMLDGDL